MKIKAVIHEAEEGGYWAEVPALKGCCTQGETIEELKDMLKDAIEAWLDAMSVPENELNQQSQILELNI